MTTGSMLACGIEPCAPRPNRRICRLSAAEVIGPALPGDRAGGPDHDVLAEHDIGLGEALEQAVVDHGLRALRRLLAGWKTAISVPCQASRALREQRGRADQPGHVHVMAAGMRHRHRVPVAIRRRDLAGIGQAGRFLDGSASMSARSMTVGPSPLRSRPTTPVLPTPVVTS